MIALLLAASILVDGEQARPALPKPTCVFSIDGMQKEQPCEPFAPPGTPKESLESRVAKLEAQQVETKRVAHAMAGHIFRLGMAGSADIVASEVAFFRCPGCYEANPGGVNYQARQGLKVGAGLALVGICWKLETGGHHKTALIVSWSGTGTSGALAGVAIYHAVKRK